MKVVSDADFQRNIVVVNGIENVSCKRKTESGRMTYRGHDSDGGQIAAKGGF